jgi:hypothetical protein
MGEAKRRGTFEERKKEAIDAGRVKKRYPRMSNRKMEKIAQKMAQDYLHRIALIGRGQ